MLWHRGSKRAPARVRLSLRFVLFSCRVSANYDQEVSGGAVEAWFVKRQYSALLIRSVQGALCCNSTTDVSGETWTFPRVSSLHWRECRSTFTGTTQSTALFIQLRLRNSRFDQRPELTLLISYPFHSQGWSISNFSCSLTRNYNITHFEELGFSSLTQMKDDYTANSQYLTLYIAGQMTERIDFFNLKRNLDQRSWSHSRHRTNNPLRCYSRWVRAGSFSCMRGPCSSWHNGLL